MTFAAAAVGVLLLVVILAGAASPLILWLALMVRHDDSEGRLWRPYVRLWVASFAVSFASITVGVWLASNGVSDDASHCAPGTRYVGSNRLVGKTVEHDWACVPA